AQEMRQLHELVRGMRVESLLGANAMPDSHGQAAPAQIIDRIVCRARSIGQYLHQHIVFLAQICRPRQHKTSVQPVPFGLHRRRRPRTLPMEALISFMTISPASSLATRPRRARMHAPGPANQTGDRDVHGRMRCAWLNGLMRMDAMAMSQTADRAQ